VLALFNNSRGVHGNPASHHGAFLQAKTVVNVVLIRKKKNEKKEKKEKKRKKKIHFSIELKNYLHLSKTPASLHDSL